MLNPKQQLFVSEYLKCFNATKAAKAAGYAPNRQQGSRLLSNADIKQALQEAFTENVMTPEEVLMHLSVIARADIDMVVDSKGNLDLAKAQEYGASNLIRKVESRTITTEDSDIAEGKIEMYDRVRALELLAKYHDLLTTHIKIDDWHSQAITDIKSGVINYEALVEAFDQPTATRLFAEAGISVSVIASEVEEW